jgi:hypothetical protein
MGHKSAETSVTEAIIAHQSLCQLFTEKEQPYPNDEQALSVYAVLWLNGLLPGKDGSSFPQGQPSIAV